MNENDKRRIRKRTDMFAITEGKLYYKGGKSNKGENKLVITRDQKSSILKLCHIDNGCHMGMEKTFYKLSERYYWKGMSTDLKDVLRQGLPLELVSDNGGEFNSRLTASLQEQYGYRHILITPYHPQSNRRCERYNQTLKSMLNKTVEEKASEWEKIVPKCAFAYNTSKQAGTKYSPFHLMYWRNPIIPNEN
ncbi:unnamed protein product [Mytilus edulis]|uniref:Integrase catalytic domain-containing protein n=1 Tax=Mytilus edulis TaxID=6550 RepID=A0A8S3SA67_MYTED|nr:unnamed protein product [Mytilus edulis]